MTIIYLLHFSIIIYTIIILWFIIGNLLNKIEFEQSHKSPPISVIVAIRNGEEVLAQFINNLKSQIYSGDIEFILVDDNSIDNTAYLIKEVVNDNSIFKYETSNNGDPILSRKKRALDAGIKKAKYEWLLFTDVDCQLQTTWVSTMSKYFKNNYDYVIGYSEVKQGTKWVTRFQYFDFLMLMICAKGTTNNQNAWACSGQNQAYRKSLYNKIGGFSKISDKMQGDDSLFLQLYRRYNSNNIIFTDELGCRTTSRQELSWISFLKQRIRWSGDARIMWKYNFIFFISMLSVFFLSLLIIITLLIGLFYNFHYLIILKKVLIIQFLLELTLYIVGSKILLKPLQLFNFCFWYFLHIPYVLIMGMCSFFSNKIKWRGR